MPLRLFRAKKDDACEIHGKGTHAANRALISLVIVSFLLILWHVWAYGPTVPAVSPDAAQRPYPLLVGSELWDLLFNRHGILAEIWDVLPYFIVGILIAALIRTYKLAVRMQRSLTRFGFSSIFLASVIGVLTPLCACGILTTAISLLFAGLPMAPVMALLVSSPLMSPTTYLISLNDLGPQWTVIRTLAAFLMGLFAGLLTHFLRNRGFQTADLFIDGVIPRGDFHDDEYPREDLRCNCRQQFGHRVAVRTGNRFLILMAKSAEMIWPVGKYVLVGIALGTIIERYIPSGWIYSLFGKDDPLNVLWITIGSVPVFLHQISASGILHHIKSGLDGTLNAGAGLAFLIGGPVTAVPTMTMLWALFRKRLFFLYLFICFVGTVTLAYSFQYLVFVPHVDTDNPLLRGVTSLSGGSSAVITKTDKHVRIVMNPEGRNLIAVYTNDLEGRGPAVFDAGMDRLRGASSGKHDDARYLRNVAEWLDENGSSLQKRKILIYDNSGESGHGRQVMSDAFLESLRKQSGFGIDRTDRAETPDVSADLLVQYSQVWFLDDAPGSGARFTEDELRAIGEFSDDGGGLLIAAGPRQGDAAGMTPENQLSSRFGVSFNGAAVFADELPVSTSFYFVGRIAGSLEKLYRFMK